MTYEGHNAKLFINGEEFAFLKAEVTMQEAEVVEVEPGICEVTYHFVVLPQPLYASPVKLLEPKQN